MAKKTPKTKKTDEKRPNPAPEGEGDLVVRLRASISRATGVLDTCVKQLETKLTNAKEYDRDTASHLAWLQKQMATTLGEVRKLDAAANQRITRITPEIVVQWLRLQTSDYRAQLARQIIAMDDGEGVLA